MKLGESLTLSADRRISIKISLDTIMDPLCISQVVSEQRPKLFQTEEPPASYDDLSLDYLS
jgi:hypothetical protein